MNMRMLIDARHREETRVAVVKGNRIEEFDFESAEHKQLKGNIYLAKVTRVEPSLQAAFVDYGGNRHGFLAFSEIHPDYYQIPREDREALLAEEAEHAAEEAALRDADLYEDSGSDENGEDIEDAPEFSEGGEEEPRDGRRRRGGPGEEQSDELRRKRMALRRRYKIQDVIKRRQVMLIQVVKEERGNKGAALTTYLSLAGRYCVLMPNTSHGGGISRKISNTADRKRLKSIISDLKLPPSMGCIVRTAGLSRTKPEIKRDFDYLARLWDEIREKTLKSSAPALIHNDSDLIKRAIRDIYNRDIDEVIVEGEEGYRQAKDFMKLLMPSHARRVQQYADPVSLFQRYGVEDQLAAMYHPVVQLKSGGYLVINPTEALVSIDINSGRSTREHGIEQTAVATNLEAAREIARQLRLRDMAGLVVIDFIDMEHGSNVRKVEKAMKDALKDDRARIQVGRISGFGLMEMSRQRLRTGVLEASTRACPHCEGTGLVRTASSAGLSALRMLEEEAARGRGSVITLRASQEAAFYVLNNKRREIDEIEQRYGVTIAILSDGEIEGARMSVEASGPRPTRVVEYHPIEEEDDDDVIADEAEAEDEEEEAEFSAAEEEERGEQREGGRRRRRRRRRKPRTEDGGEDRSEMTSADAEDADGEDAEADDSDAEAPSTAEASAADGHGEDRPKSRRGRRGGRRRRGGARTDEAAAVGDAAEAEYADAAESEASAVTEADAVPDAAPEVAAEAPVEDAPAKPKRRPRARKAAVPEASEAPAEETEQAVVAAVPAEAVVEDAPVEDAPAKPKRAPRRKKAVADEAEAAPSVEHVEQAEPAPKPTRARATKARSKDAVPVATEANGTVDQAVAVQEEAPEDDDAGTRRGWWQRTFGA